MSNKWVEHVKSEAKRLNISYACAMTNPEVKENYNKYRKPTASDIKGIIKERGQWHLFAIDNGELKNLNFKNKRGGEGPLIGTSDLVKNYEGKTLIITRLSQNLDNDKKDFKFLIKIGKFTTREIDKTGRIKRDVTLNRGKGLYFDKDELKNARDLVLDYFKKDK
jgi:hypothetical protein